MLRFARPILIAGLSLVASAEMAWPQYSVSPPDAASVMGGEGARPVLQTWRDDATLHDVQFVGSQTGWAVGDHGTIWRTHDAGGSWHVVPCPVDLPLRSVCFLTDRVGWIAGGEMTPHTRLSSGVVLATQDGGATWDVLGADSLPRLHFVKFFDINTGIAAGDASALHPSGLFLTDDGGATWRDVAGHQSRGWRNGDFLSPEDGVVVGQRGRTFFVSRGRLLEPEFAELRLQNLGGVRLQAQHTSWLVGDGATVRMLGPGSVAWQDPPGWLPGELRDIVDFTAVAARGPHVWLAGRPGSVIWHSPDGGQTWNAQHTRQPQAIEALDFSSETHGIAVGAFGSILRTVDGGNTWGAIRGGGRRAAMLTIHARPEQVSFALLAREAGELGYRTITFLPFRRDTGTASEQHHGLDVTLHEAVTAAGAAMAEQGWRLPIGLPDIDHHTEQILAEWNRQTDGRLKDAFIGDVVCRIRTWRPSVIILDEPGADDAAVALLNEAVLKAVELAADPASFVDQQRYAGLSAWQVGKVYMRLAAGSTGDTYIDPHEALPRMGAITTGVALDSRSRLPGMPRESIHREAYRLLRSHTDPHAGHVVGGGFFSGISLSAGSDARRDLPAYDDTLVAAAQRNATKQRHFNATVLEWMNSPRQAAAMVGQLETFLREIPDDQGAHQLYSLANEYRRQSRWELVEMTLVELTERYPRHPLAEDAVRWLFQFWSSAEVTWQRSRNTDATRETQTVGDAARAASQVRQAFELSKVDPRRREVDLADVVTDRPVTSSEGLGLAMPAGNVHSLGTSAIWEQQALSSIRRMREESPRLSETPQVQFPLAALLRRRDVHASADRIYQDYLTSGADQLWKRTAAAELWLTQPNDVAPKLPVSCRPAAVRPMLDGVLSDPCWLDATEIPLRRSAEAAVVEGDHPFAMLSYDREYLYLAASVPREPGQRADLPSYEGRSHDANLTGFDRLAVQLDVDRDYTTYYELQIDQRGWTRDACWDDQSWNPKWHVAASADEKHWRIEAAIPFSELAPRPPASPDVWAVGVTRIIPAVGVEGWTHPAGEQPRPAAFGLVRFE